MKKTSFVLLSVLLILLLSISAAAAADDSITTLSTQSDEDIVAAVDENIENENDIAGSAEQDDIEAENTQDTVLSEEEEIYPDININAQNILEGQDAKITANLTDENGQIISKDFSIRVSRITDDYDEISVIEPQTMNGNGSLIIPNLISGTYHISAEFKGEGIYHSCRNSIDFFVKTQKETPKFDMSIDGYSFDTDGYYTDDEEISFDFHLYTPTENRIPGSVDVYMNGAYNTTLYVNDGMDSFEFYAYITEKTDYEFKLVFRGDDAFDPANHTFTLHPREKRSYIQISTATVIYGEDAVIEIELCDVFGEAINESYMINILENTNSPDRLNLTYTATGLKTITVQANKLKKNANYTITAKYDGNSIYTPSDSKEVFSVVSYMPTHFELVFDDSIFKDDDEIVYAIGNKTEIYYELIAGEYENIKQYIDIYVNGEVFETVMTDEMQGTVIITGLVKGLNTVSFVYNGTEGYGACNHTFNITNYEKKSKIVADVSYGLLGKDVTATFTLTDGKNIINEDFEVEVYKGEYDFEGGCLARYTILNGTGTITIPSTVLNKRGSYTLISFFEGDEINSIVKEYTELFVDDEKQEIYISASDSINVFNNSVKIPFSVRSNGETVPGLVDVYLNGEFHKTINYTKGTYQLVIEDIKLGKSIVKLSVNETDLQKSASQTIEINYELLNTIVNIENYGYSEYEMWQGLQFYFNLASHYYSIDQPSGNAEIYINGEKITTISIIKSPYADNDDDNIPYVYYATTPGQYNISVHYLGDNVTFNESWSRNLTFTLTQSDVNTETSSVLENSNKTNEIRIGEYLCFYAHTKNNDNKYFNDYVDIYINGAKLTTIYNGDRFKFMPTEEGEYNITSKFEGNNLYPATDFSNAITVTVKPASRPAVFNATMNKQAVQGETLEINYTFVSNGEVIREGDENNFIKIFLNNNLVATTTELTGTIPVKLIKAGTNFINFIVYSNDRTYTFNGRTTNYCDYSCNVEANPEGRVLTSLNITSTYDNYQIGDSIVITHTITNMSELNCPDELGSLVDIHYDWDLKQDISTVKINYYMNGEFIGTSYANGDGKHPKFKFTFTNTTKIGWYNFTAVMEDGENVIGSTCNLSLYIKALQSRVDSTRDTYTTVINKPSDIYFTLKKSRNGAYINNELLDIYINGVKNTTINSTYDKFTFTSSTSGEFNITAVYNGSEMYSSSSKKIRVVVNKIHSSLALSTNDTEVQVGTPASIEINLNTLGEPLSGFVDIYVNDVKNDTVFVNGSLVYSFTPQTADTHTIYAYYAGDDYYMSRTSSSITITPQRILASISISTQQKSYTRDTDILIKVDALSNGKPVNRGTVEFNIRIEAQNFKRTLDLSQNDTYLYVPYVDGRYRFYATYNDNVYYAYPSNEITFDLAHARSFVSVSSNETTLEIGSNASVVVQPQSYDKLINSGKVHVYVNNVLNTTLDINETNIFEFTPDSIGTYEIYARYIVNNVYSSSISDVIKVTVNKKSSRLNITADKTSFEIGSAADISIDGVLDTGNNLVYIFINDEYNTTVDVTKTSVFEFKPSTSGTYNIRAVYNGTGTYSSAESNVVTVTVNKVSTALTLSVDKSAIIIGDKIRIGFNLTSHGEALSRPVVLTLNGENSTIDNSIMLTPDKAGEYTISVHYAGDDYYSAASSETVKVVVSKKATSLAITGATEVDALSAASINITLAGEGSMTDKVEVYANGVKIDTVDLAKTGTYQFAPNKAGNYTVKVKYPGNNTYSECESNALNILFKPIATKIASSSIVATAIDAKIDGKKGAYLSLTLKDVDNKALAGKTVTFTLNREVFTVKTDSNGIAKVQVNIKKAGTYPAAISFGGDDTYKASSAASSVKVNKQKPKLTAKKKTFKRSAKTKKITATLKTKYGKALKAKKLTFTIKGKKYTAKTNAKGVATAKIKLTKKGKHTCKVNFKGDGTYSAITKKVKITIK